jgi:hypothetical protein
MCSCTHPHKYLRHINKIKEHTDGSLHEVYMADMYQTYILKNKVSGIMNKNKNKDVTRHIINKVRVSNF